MVEQRRYGDALRCWKTHEGASWCVEGAREAFSWCLLKRKVGRDVEQDSKVHLGCWKVQGSMEGAHVAQFER